MLTYTFNNTSLSPLYEQLYNFIKKDIMEYVFSANEKLPSKRSLAAQLGISVITVENAYEQLLAEGYIYSIPKKGFYVSEINMLPKTKTMDFKKNTYPKQNESYEYLADFTSNQTDSNNFPFTIWSRLIRKILSEDQASLMENPPAEGNYLLRTAISKHLYEFRQMKVSPEQIIIGAGTEYLYALLIQLLGHDKIYAVENPGYKKIAKIYESNCVKCQYVNIDKNGIIPAEIKKAKADIIHISPSHHFPTGTIMPIKRRNELLEWAYENENRYIIEDDYDSEFRFNGQIIPSLESIDTQAKVIYINTFTKSLSSTIRISYMVLPEKLMEVFYSKLSFYSSSVSNFEQLTLARFIDEGYFEKHINRMRNYYRNQRDTLLDIINKSKLSSLINISEENSGLHFIMHIKTALRDKEIIERARKNKIKISSLSEYYLTESNNESHSFIINYSSLKRDTLKEAIEKLYISIIE